MSEQEELFQCRGSRCEGLEPKPRSEFYPSKQTGSGLMRVCKSCHAAYVEKYQHSPKGRLALRRRQALVKQAVEALRSGALGQVYPCEFVDGNCSGQVEAHFPDETKPEEFFWFCRHHRELIRRLKTRPSYEKLALLVERWS